MVIETTASEQKCLAFVNQMLARTILDVEAGTGAPYALRGLSELFDCSVALILLRPELKVFSYPRSTDANVCAELSVSDLIHELERTTGDEVNPLVDESILKNVATSLDVKTGSFAVLGDFRPIGVLLIDCESTKLADFQLGCINSAARAISLATGTKPNKLIDQMTELWTLKQLERIALMQIELSESQNSRFSLALGNIDDLKEISDAHGHSSSAEVIKFVARRIKDHALPEFFCAQIMDTNLAVLMPNYSVEQALPMIEQIREDIGKQTIQLSYGPTCNVAISFGLAEFPAHAKYTSSFTELLWHAQDALGRAKRLGKNRTYVYRS